MFGGCVFNILLLIFRVEIACSGLSLFFILLHHLITDGIDALPLVIESLGTFSKAFLSLCFHCVDYTIVFTRINMETLKIFSWY